MPLTGETFRLRTTSTDNNARLDIKAQDFWDCSKRGANFDVRVFNSHAPSNCRTTKSACYHQHGQEKRRVYKDRVINVEHSPSPLLLSPQVVVGDHASATIALKRLARLISEKQLQSFSTTLNFIRCKIAFPLID
jgi:hypothetical protein